MNQNDVITEIFAELRRAEKKFPGWPDDIIHGSAIVVEESGELVRACLDYYYHRTKGKEEIIKEAIQTAAMAIRLLLNITMEAPNDKA